MGLSVNRKYLAIIVIQLFICFFVFQNNVSAYTHPTISNQQMELILNRYKQILNNNNYSTNRGYTRTSGEILTYLETLNISNVLSVLNNYLSNVPFDFSLDNLSVIITYAGDTSQLYMYFDFYISNNNLLYNDLGKFCISTDSGQNAGLYIYSSNNKPYSIIRIITNPNGSTVTGSYNSYTYDNGTVRSTIYPKILPNIVEDTYITNWDFVIPINYSTRVWYGNNSKSYDLTNQPLDLNPIIIEPNNSVSSYGYLYSPSSTPPNRVNLRATNNVNIDNDFYIGDDLNFTYNFYYMSGNEKISVNQYVDYTLNNNISETGQWYHFFIPQQNLQNLPNNTLFYLDVTVSAGNQTDTMLQGQQAFYTVSEAIDSGQTGTITNESGETTGNINLSGIESGLNNLINNIQNLDTGLLGSVNESGEHVPGIIENSTTQLTETITETFTDIPDISGETITSGEISSAVNIEFIDDPYANMWTTLLSGFSDALTSDNNFIDVPIPHTNTVKRVYVSDIVGFIPQELTIFLGIVSTVAVVFFITKFSHSIVLDIQTASIENVADKLTEDFVSSLF